MVWFSFTSKPDDSDTEVQGHLAAVDLNNGKIDLSSYGIQAEWENVEGTGLEFDWVVGERRAIA